MTRSARVAAVAVVSTLAGCAALDGLLQRGIATPKVSVLSASPSSVDFEGMTVIVELRVQNPNAVGLRVTRLAWQLEVEGGRVASGDAPGGFNIPANGAATSRVTARVLFADLAKLVKVAEARERVAFHVAGKVAIETPVGTIDVPWSFAGDLPLPQLPHVELTGIRIGRQTFSETEVLLKLRLQNPNSFSLPAAVLRLEVELGGERVAQAASQPVPAILPGEAATLEVPVRLSLLGAGRAILEGRGKPIRVAVHGTAGFGWMQLPFSVSGDLPLPLP
jgi:LEA14-like dessication related protein